MEVREYVIQDGNRPYPQLPPDWHGYNQHINNFATHGYKLLKETIVPLKTHVFTRLSGTRTVEITHRPGGRSTGKTISPPQKEELSLFYRPGTTDENAIKEVTIGKAYRRKKLDFDVMSGEHWIDLGANIGSFAAYCWIRGATASCYEPDPDCFALLHRSFSNLGGFKLHNHAITEFSERSLTFCKGTKETDHYRATIAHTRTPHPSGVLPNRCVTSLFPKGYVGFGPGIRVGKDIPRIDGIKMDIESAEFGIIDRRFIPPCNKLVMEYHFSRNKSLADFRRRIKILKEVFRVVDYPPGLDRDYPGDKFPGFFDRLIFCKEWR